jgi:hypothetical protein
MDFWYLIKLHTASQPRRTGIFTVVETSNLASRWKLLTTEKIVNYITQLNRATLRRRQSLSWSRNFSPSTEPGIHYRVHNSPSLDPILSHGQWPNEHSNGR